MSKAIQNRINQIKKLVEEEYKVSGTHFQNGRNLHSSQYYYAKKYFLNVENCSNMALILAEKVKAILSKEGLQRTTLIGFRSYTRLLLDKTIEILENKEINFQLIEPIENSLVWSDPNPALEPNSIVILPITCTCSNFFRIKEFIEGVQTNTKVNLNFISVFQIFDEKIKEENLPLIIDSENTGLTHQFYDTFDWKQIEPQEFIIANSNRNEFKGHVLIDLYSLVFLPENCELCFPKEGANEEPLLSTHDNYETPNIIEGAPKFDNNTSKGDFNHFFRVEDGVSPLALNVKVGKESYLEYIRGDIFYKQNKQEILKFFNSKLKTKIKTSASHIIFISTENRYSSSCVEDLSLLPILKDKQVTILRFNPDKEFIDNFISLHGELLRQEDTQVVFYEDVISAGKTFMLISNYIKHAKYEGSYDVGLRGVDLFLTLVDRTLRFTKIEILKKMNQYDSEYEEIEGNFIAVFKLNAPIISAVHLGNPLEKKKLDMLNMAEQSHMDSLKMYVLEELRNKVPVKIEDRIDLGKASYSPFINERNNESLEDLFYYSYGDRSKLNLFKLHITHEINCALSGLYSLGGGAEMIKTLVKEITGKKSENSKKRVWDYYFVDDASMNGRNEETEHEVICDAIIKTLTGYPFIYYKDIYLSVFEYSINQLKGNHKVIVQNGIKKFNAFRALKFLIRRSIDLNSNFIISKEFLACVKEQYNGKRINQILDIYENLKTNPDQPCESGSISEQIRQIKNENITYKKNQIKGYMSFLIYCYKNLIYKNPYRSVKIEELINSENLLPQIITEIWDSETPIKELQELLSDPYFKLTGMIKAENIHLLDELKEWHKKNYKDKETPLGGERLYRKYFENGRTNDLELINLNRLLKHSRFSDLDGEEGEVKIREIKEAICNMLATVSLIESKNSSGTEKNLNAELKEIFDAAIKIIQPGIKTPLSYAFFVNPRKREDNQVLIDKVYSFTSEKPPQEQVTINLHEKGLIYNLLNGLYKEEDNKSPETLLTCLNIKEEDCISFDTHYFIEESQTKREQIEFAALYQNDQYNYETKKGLKLLSEAKMCLAIRLSNWTDAPKSEKKNIEGQGVLIITTGIECNRDNFLDFMSNEKIRLLMLIKEELMEYLQKQFDNHSFIDVIDSQKFASKIRRLSHGTKNYIKSQIKLVDKIYRNESNKTDNKLEFDVVTDALLGQILAKELKENLGSIQETKKYTLLQITTLVRVIMKSKSLGFRSIKEGNWKLSINEKTELNIHPLIYNVVIPELIINMIKYGKDSTESPFIIEIYGNCIVFENKTNPSTNPTNKDRGEGLEMCNEIMQALSFPMIMPDTQKEEYTIITLNLTKIC